MYLRMPSAPVFALLFCTVSSFHFLSCKQAEQRGDKLVVSNHTNGQSVNAQVYGLDKSPMDMAYFPVDYPIKKMSGKMQDELVVRVIYSRPRVEGRKIFGDIIKYGSAWRLGANEATEIEFFRDVTIMGKAVQKGRYVLYCIPSEDSWMLILNSELNTWGLKIDPAKDVQKFEIPNQKINQSIEVFTMEFSGIEKEIQLQIGWDSVRVALPITY